MIPQIREALKSGNEVADQTDVSIEVISIQGYDNEPINVLVYKPRNLTDILPYTYTFIGQLEPFRDETLTYVTKLAQAGVDIEFHLYPGSYHGFEGLNPQSPVAQNAKNEYIHEIKSSFERISEQQ